MSDVSSVIQLLLRRNLPGGAQESNSWIQPWEIQLCLPLLTNVILTINIRYTNWRPPVSERQWWSRAMKQSSSHWTASSLTGSLTQLHKAEYAPEWVASSSKAQCEHLGVHYPARNEACYILIISTLLPYWLTLKGLVAILHVTAHRTN